MNGNTKAASPSVAPASSSPQVNGKTKKGGLAGLFSSSSSSQGSSSKRSSKKSKLSNPVNSSTSAVMTNGNDSSGLETTSDFDLDLTNGVASPLKRSNTLTSHLIHLRKLFTNKNHSSSTQNVNGSPVPLRDTPLISSLVPKSPKQLASELRASPSMLRKQQQEQQQQLTPPPANNIKSSSSSSTSSLPKQLLPTSSPIIQQSNAIYNKQLTIKTNNNSNSSTNQTPSSHSSSSNETSNQQHRTTSTTTVQLSNSNKLSANLNESISIPMMTMMNHSTNMSTNNSFTIKT